MPNSMLPLEGTAEAVVRAEPVRAEILALVDEWIGRIGRDGTDIVEEGEARLVRRVLAHVTDARAWNDQLGELPRDGCAIVLAVADAIDRIVEGRDTPDDAALRAAWDRAR